MFNEDVSSTEFIAEVAEDVFNGKGSDVYMYWHHRFEM